MFMGGHPRRPSTALRERDGAEGRLAQGILWPAIWSIASILSIWAFARSAFAADWPAWLFPPLLVSGFWLAVKTIPEDRAIRIALHSAALLLIPLMAAYSIIQALFGMTLIAWILSPVLVIVLWSALLDVADAEFD
jgi:hypothetical protein